MAIDGSIAMIFFVALPGLPRARSAPQALANRHAPTASTEISGKPNYMRRKSLIGPAPFC